MTQRESGASSRHAARCTMHSVAGCRALRWCGTGSTLRLKPRRGVIVARIPEHEAIGAGVPRGIDLGADLHGAKGTSVKLMVAKCLQPRAQALRRRAAGIERRCRRDEPPGCGTAQCRTGRPMGRASGRDNPPVPAGSGASVRSRWHRDSNRRNRRCRQRQIPARCGAEAVIGEDRYAEACCARVGWTLRGAGRSIQQQREQGEHERESHGTPSSAAVQASFGMRTRRANTRLYLACCGSVGIRSWREAASPLRIAPKRRQRAI